MCLSSDPNKLFGEMTLNKNINIIKLIVFIRELPSSLRKQSRECFLVIIVRDRKSMRTR